MQKRDWPNWLVYALAVIFFFSLAVEATLLVQQAHTVISVTGKATATVSLNIEAEAYANLSVTKTATPDPVNISSPITYRITINSTGSGTAYNITLNETYPSNVTFLTSSPSAINGTNTSFIIANLSAGDVYVANITVNVTPDTANGTALLNAVNVTFTNTTGGLESRIATATVTAIIPANETEEEETPPGGGGGGGGGGGCIDACVLNATLCSTVGRLRCMRYYDADPCTEYAPDPCPAGTLCSHGECSVYCIEEWDCTDWSDCSDGIETRTCKELFGCATPEGTPTMERACVPRVEEIPDRLLSLIDRGYISVPPLAVPLEVIAALPVILMAVISLALLILFGIVLFVFGKDLSVLILYLRIYHVDYLLHTKQYELAHNYIDHIVQPYFASVQLDLRNAFHRRLARLYYGTHRDLARHYASLAHTAGDTAKHTFWNERAEHYAREVLKYQ